MESWSNSIKCLKIFINSSSTDKKHHSAKIEQQDEVLVG